MTVEEALQWFKGFYNGNCEREDFENTICADCNFPCRHGLPILRAISALEEIQQYRAIGLGSPEEVEQDLLLYKADREVLKEYEAIGTVSEFRENKNFLEFLYNHIPLNEMEQYLAMYHASKEKGEYRHE